MEWMENYDISTFSLATKCSASELHPQFRKQLPTTKRAAMKPVSMCYYLLISDSCRSGAGDWHCSSLSWLETKGTSIYTTPAFVTVIYINAIVFCTSTGRNRTDQLRNCTLLHLFSVTKQIWICASLLCLLGLTRNSEKPLPVI